MYNKSNLKGALDIMPAAEKVALKNLQKNLKAIEEFESKFILQKAMLKKSAKNYSKTKKLIQTCKDKLEKYANLISTIEKDVSGNNSREREAQKILADRIRDIADYKDRLDHLKEDRKSELYGPESTKIVKKSNIKYFKEQLHNRIDNFDLQKAVVLNNGAEKFIKEDLTNSEKIIAKAISEISKIKISTDKFENLSKILTQEMEDLSEEYSRLKQKRASSESMTGWILDWGSWGAKTVLTGALTAISSYATTRYIIPLIFE